MQFQITSIPTPRRVIGNFEGEGGGGFQKPKFLNMKLHINWNFWRGGEGQTKKPSVGGVLSFSVKQHITRLFEETRAAYQCKDLRK